MLKILLLVFFDLSKIVADHIFFVKKLLKKQSQLTIYLSKFVSQKIGNNLDYNFSIFIKFIYQVFSFNNLDKKTKYFILIDLFLDQMLAKIIIINFSNISEI